MENDIKRKPGRPRTYAKPVLVRLTPDVLDTLDLWIRVWKRAHPKTKLARPEAIRLIIKATGPKQGQRLGEYADELTAAVNHPAVLPAGSPAPPIKLVDGAIYVCSHCGHRYADGEQDHRCPIRPKAAEAKKPVVTGPVRRMHAKPEAAPPAAPKPKAKDADRCPHCGAQYALVGYTHRCNR